MKGLVIFFALALAVGCVSADWKPALKVKFDAAMAPWSGKDCFYDIPRTTTDAIDLGWKRTERPKGPLPTLVLLCPADPHLCAFFDDETGHVAGLQICIPQNEFTNATFDWTTQGFTKWTPTTVQGEPTEYQCTAQFFHSEEYFKKTPEERLASRKDKILQEDKIWLTGFNGKLDEWSDKTTDLENSIWTKQQCIPWMGQHYYYNMSSTTLCEADKLYPWFPLENSGNIVGTGFIVFGKLPVKEGIQDWFERPPKPAVMAIVPRGPSCLYDLAGNVGLLTMHIYYVDKPWTILCSIFGWLF
ncbi:uncharacterized protein [Maniola hyperantus]|uniref:uncharacterized protein n=1 Tax=Aphantopus hyperantus TaxID=2795564 RepID=UPI001567D115|nr:uncharacterized protein LOC117990605 [Maniola hyperantus]